MEYPVAKCITDSKDRMSATMERLTTITSNLAEVEIYKANSDPEDFSPDFWEKTIKKYTDEIEYFQSRIRIIKIEQLIYNVIKKGNLTLLPTLRTKYVDQLGVVMDLSGNLVDKERMPEGVFLEISKSSKDNYDVITKICDAYLEITNP